MQWAENEFPRNVFYVCSVFEGRGTELLPEHFFLRWVSQALRTFPAKKIFKPSLHRGESKV